MAPGHREAQCSSAREPRALRWLLNTRRLLQAKMEPSATAAGAHVGLGLLVCHPPACPSGRENAKHVLRSEIA